MGTIEKIIETITLEMITVIIVTIIPGITKGMIILDLITGKITGQNVHWIVVSRICLTPGLDNLHKFDRIGNLIINLPTDHQTQEINTSNLYKDSLFEIQYQTNFNHHQTSKYELTTLF